MSKREWGGVIASLSDARDRLIGRGSNEGRTAETEERVPAITESEYPLFECQSCETVYIAPGKDQCSRCDNTLVRVESTQNKTSPHEPNTPITQT